jgi:hypothetical protein
MMLNGVRVETSAPLFTALHWHAPATGKGKVRMTRQLNDVYEVCVSINISVIKTQPDIVYQYPGKSYLGGQGIG